MTKPTLKTYDNVFFAKQELLPWSKTECFPFDKYEESDFYGISALILDFKSSHRDQSKWIRDENLYKNFDDFFSSLVLSYRANTYFIIKEYHFANKSKLRSYKGFLNKKIKDISDFFELEIEGKNNSSIFLASVKVTSLNIRMLVSDYLNNETSFILSDLKGANYPSDKIFSFDDVSSLRFGVDGPIDYLGLVLHYCNAGYVINRIGGDGGDQELSLQSFCKAEVRGVMDECIHQLVP